VRTWPDVVEVVSSRATLRALQRVGEARLKSAMADVSKQIHRVEEAGGAPSPSSFEQDQSREAEHYRAALLEYQSVQLTLPTMVIEGSLTLRRPSMTVEILWLGRGHTDGDLWIHVPERRVLITGDSLTAGFPFMSDSYPYEWIDVLGAAAELDFDFAITGHGPVIEGKDVFEVWRSYFRDLLELTSTAYAEGETVEALSARVSARLMDMYRHQFPDGLEGLLAAHVQKAYEVIAF
jgi:glyoxylase-like metal-dependent hydrolase (beta-lactamase superfamily II)